MIIEGITRPYFENAYILGDERTKQAIVVDPGAEPERVLAALDRQGLTAKLILRTHAHIDHIGAVTPVRQSTGALFAMSRIDYDDIDVQTAGLAHVLTQPLPLSPSPTATWRPATSSKSAISPCACCSPPATPAATSPSPATASSSPAISSSAAASAASTSSAATPNSFSRASMIRYCPSPMPPRSAPGTAPSPQSGTSVRTTAIYWKWNASSQASWPCRRSPRWKNPKAAAHAPPSPACTCSAPSPAKCGTSAPSAPS